MKKYQYKEETVLRNVSELGGGVKDSDNKNKTEINCKYVNCKTWLFKTSKSIRMSVLKNIIIFAFNRRTLNY